MQFLEVSIIQKNIHFWQLNTSSFIECQTANSTVLRALPEDGTNRPVVPASGPLTLMCQPGGGTTAEWHPLLPESLWPGQDTSLPSTWAPPPEDSGIRVAWVPDSRYREVEFSGWVVQTLGSVGLWAPACPLSWCHW